METHYFKEDLRIFFVCLCKSKGLCVGAVNKIDVEGPILGNSV